MVRSKIDTLTPDPSFGHNLCCKYSNGPCESILDIQVLRVFQWYKELVQWSIQWVLTLQIILELQRVKEHAPIFFFFHCFIMGPLRSLGVHHVR
jgi:hypothetical protein